MQRIHCLTVSSWIVDGMLSVLCTVVNKSRCFAVVSEINQQIAMRILDFNLICMTCGEWSLNLFNVEIVYIHVHAIWWILIEWIALSFTIYIRVMVYRTKKWEANRNLSLRNKREIVKNSNFGTFFFFCFICLIFSSSLNYSFWTKKIYIYYEIEDEKRFWKFWFMIEAFFDDTHFGREHIRRRKKKHLEN